MGSKPKWLPMNKISLTFFYYISPFTLQSQPWLTTLQNRQSVVLSAKIPFDICFDPFNMNRMQITGQFLTENWIPRRFWKYIKKYILKICSFVLLMNAKCREISTFIFLSQSIEQGKERSLCQHGRKGVGRMTSTITCQEIRFNTSECVIHLLLFEYSRGIYPVGLNGQQF